MQFLVVLCCHNIPLRNFNNRSGGVTSRSWSHAHKGMIKDRKFILLSYKMHFLNNSLKKERKSVLGGLLACGSLNVVLMTNLSSCGSLPFFPHYTMGQKTPKPTQPQLKHVGPLCSVCCLIQMDPERRIVLWCHGAIFYYQSSKWTCETHTNQTQMSN